MSHSTFDYCNIKYAYDITQIIAYSGKSSHLMAHLAVQEITKVNGFGRKWKIKTNNSKFTILPIVVIKKEERIINNNIIPCKKSCKILGLKISSTGLKQHVDDVTRKGKVALQELQRFRNLSTKIKIHLYFPLSSIQLYH